MEASKHTPNGTNETPGGTTKTPRLPRRIETLSIIPVLPQYKWKEIREIHNESTVSSGTEIAILQA